MPMPLLLGRVSHLPLQRCNNAQLLASAVGPSLQPAPGHSNSAASWHMSRHTTALHAAPCLPPLASPGSGITRRPLSRQSANNLRAACHPAGSQPDARRSNNGGKTKCTFSLSASSCAWLCTTGRAGSPSAESSRSMSTISSSWRLTSSGLAGGRVADGRAVWALGRRWAAAGGGDGGPVARWERHLPRRRGAPGPEGPRHGGGRPAGRSAPPSESRPARLPSAGSPLPGPVQAADQAGRDARASGHQGSLVPLVLSVGSSCSAQPALGGLIAGAADPGKDAPRLERAASRSRRPRLPPPRRSDLANTQCSRLLSSPLSGC